MAKKCFCSVLGYNAARNWQNRITKIKKRHEFDDKYGECITSRTSKTRRSFEEVMTNENISFLTKDSLIKVISDITNLPDKVINTVILDLFEIIGLALSKNKKISLHGIASFSIEDNKIAIYPSRKYKEVCGIK